MAFEPDFDDLDEDIEIATPVRRHGKLIQDHPLGECAMHKMIEYNHKHNIALAEMTQDQVALAVGSRYQGKAY